MTEKEKVEFAEELFSASGGSYSGEFKGCKDDIVSIIDKIIMKQYHENKAGNEFIKKKGL